MSGARYPLKTIAEVVGGTLAVATDTAEDPIEHLLIDSRHATITPTTLFIALRGPRHDGHRYVKDLIARGVRGRTTLRTADAAYVPRVSLLQLQAEVIL